MFYFLRKTTLPEWLLLAGGTVLLYWPTFMSDGLGLVLVAIVYMLQKAKNRKELMPAVG